MKSHPGTVVSAMVIMMPWLCVFDDLAVTCFLEPQETVPLAVDNDPWVASSSFSSVKDRKRMIMMMMMMMMMMMRRIGMILVATEVQEQKCCSVRNKCQTRIRLMTELKSKPL